MCKPRLPDMPFFINPLEAERVGILREALHEN
jgi:hypothetical protein